MYDNGKTQGGAKLFYLLDEEKLIPYETDGILPAKNTLCVIGIGELRGLSQLLGISERIVRECERNDMSKHESYEGYDFITLNIPPDVNPAKKQQRVNIYLRDKLLVFICGDPKIVLSNVEEVEREKIKINSLGRVLHIFFDRITFDDPLDIEKIEREITDLEDESVNATSQDVTFTKKITVYRKKLLALKRYYEQLVEITEAIEQNENGLIDKKVQRYFRIIANRADRLYHSVLNLRDYVTQVREAYQAQIDINLNKVMKFFTVITSVFLPLTLIVGWYGMNFSMPEYGWELGYPFVILLSLLTVTGTLVYFKKKKWF
jgi:magnesium transporter